MFQKKNQIDHIPFHRLTFDSRVQRKIVGRRLTYLTENFNLGGIGIITVSVREDGKAYVTDGQHRVRAAMQRGLGDTKVKCAVYRDLTLAEEAELFLTLNDSRSVSAIDKFMVGLVAKDPDCLGVDSILKKHGLGMSSQKGDGWINCADLLLRVYRRDPVLLNEVIAAAIEAWGTRSAALEGMILNGLSQVLARYDGELDMGLLTNKLSKYRGGPGGLLGDARGLSKIKPITVKRAVAEITVDTYNKGRRVGALSPL